MTFAPRPLLAARIFIIETIPGLSGAVVGIVGDGPHAATGSSYHLGKSQLRSDSYTIVESARDRSGLSDAASGLDIGMFSFPAGGKTHTLRTFSAWLVGQCQAGAAETLDIREVIYSTDGRNVRRWDRLKRRSDGDKSHLYHTHISYFRDSENRDKTALFRRYLTEAGLIEGEGEAMIPCRKGDQGEGVRFWQYVLNRVNAAGLTIDGDYGPKMEAAVNAYRAKHGGPGTGPSPMISGWMGYHALSLLAAGYAGKNGERGPQGPTGPAGKDGSALGGNLTVTGGSLRVVVAQEG